MQSGFLSKNALFGKLTYPREEFQLDDAAAWDALQSKAFGSLIVCNPTSDFTVSHIPFLGISTDNQRYLDCHLAAYNPMVDSLSTGTSGLVICHIDDTYIQPAWYGMGDDEVPTWLYIAVEAKVTAMPLNACETKRHVAEMTAHFETDADQPWELERMSAAKRRSMLAGIRGYRLHVDSLRGHRKLSQHKPAHAIRSMTDALRNHHVPVTAGPIVSELQRLGANKHPEYGNNG